MKNFLFPVTSHVREHVQILSGRDLGQRDEKGTPGRLTVAAALCFSLVFPLNLNAQESDGACDTLVAPFFWGTGGFVARPVNGSSMQLIVEGDGVATAETRYADADGLVVQLLDSPLCVDAFGRATECRVSFRGVQGGGWYWVNGDRNAAVSPLLCEESVGGGVPALDPGGVDVTRSSFGTGTLFLHHAQGLMGIVPHFTEDEDTAGEDADGCRVHVAPYFEGRGGFVARPVNGRSMEVTIEDALNIFVPQTETVFTRTDGLVVQLLDSALCFDPLDLFARQLPMECRVSFKGIQGGGWYWVNGDRNAAVAPLVCEERLGSGVAALDPGGVETKRSVFGTGTLFLHHTQGLMGILPGTDGGEDDGNEDDGEDGDGDGGGGGAASCVDVGPIQTYRPNTQVVWYSREVTNNCSVRLYVTARFSLSIGGKSVGSGRNREWGYGNPDCGGTVGVFEETDNYIYDTDHVDPAGDTHTLGTCHNLAYVTETVTVHSSVRSCETKLSQRGGCFAFE